MIDLVNILFKIVFFLLLVGGYDDDSFICDCVCEMVIFLFDDGISRVCVERCNVGLSLYIGVVYCVLYVGFSVF